ncbi:hypothetical protein TcWFU_007662 [Taenia crassiceps]|uniref:Uncharacterized protein n=1 Tax=Taenia crassiceps TaxID=6207 RepID=A0ABR4QBQ5_9CEST
MTSSTAASSSYHWSKFHRVLLNRPPSLEKASLKWTSKQNFLGVIPEFSYTLPEVDFVATGWSPVPLLKPFSFTACGCTVYCLDSGLYPTKEIRGALFEDMAQSARLHKHSD